MMAGKDLVPAEPGQYALVAAEAREAAELMQEALAPGETLELSDLPTVKVPTAGALNWELPSGDAAKTLEGVIVVRQPVRAYWKQSFDETGGGSPPDCSSNDLMTGVGDNDTLESGAHDCRTCPQAQYGSAKNSKGDDAPGQACRVITRLFMLQQGQTMPTMVSLPPTSYKDAKKFAVQQPLYSVEAAISLVNAQSGGGVKYSKANFAVNRVLSPEERAAAQQYRQALLPFVTQVPIARPSDYIEGDGYEEDPDY